MSDEERALMDATERLLGRGHYPVSVLLVAEYMDAEGELVEHACYVGSDSRIMGLLRWLQLRLEARTIRREALGGDHGLN